MSSVNDDALRGIFLARLAEDGGPSDENAVAAAWQRAASALRDAKKSWPSVKIDAAAFVSWFAARVDGSIAKYDADLCLVFACLARSDGAIAAFEVVARKAASAAVARIDPSPAFVDDVLQVILEKLLVGGVERKPMLADYAGRSSLRTWLATVAARTALNLRRGRRDVPDDETTSETPATSGGNPELEYAKEEHRHKFHEALRAALATLDERQRELLTASLVEGVSLDALAVRFGVSRSKVARWVTSARETLAARTRAEVCERLNIAPSDYDSVAAFVRSRLGESVVLAVKGRQ